MITIISKAYCPYCKAAIDLLDDLGGEYKNYDVTRDEALYSKVKQISASHTVPQVFIGDINGQFLWGYSEISALHQSGELEKLLK